MSTGTEDPVADKRVPACAKLNAMRAGGLQPSDIERVGIDRRYIGEARSGGSGGPRGTPILSHAFRATETRHEKHCIFSSFFS